MKQLNIKNIQKDILNQCKEIALTEKYQTAPLRVYIIIRNEIGINRNIKDIVNLGYPEDLVIAIKNEVL